MKEMTDIEPHIFKFMSLDGTVFHMRCRTILDAVFDRSLWGFLLLCNTLFAAQNVLMSELLSPREEQIHWSVQMFTFALISVNVLALLAIVLIVLGFILFRLVKLGLLKAIYIPFFYILPTALYGVSTWVGDGYVIVRSDVTILVMFLLICAFFDIIYGRFVAPYHSKYTVFEDIKTLSKNAEDKATSSTTVDEKPLSPDATPDQEPLLSHPNAAAVELPATHEHSSNNKANPRASKASASRTKINIGKQSFFSDEIRWIQSEDHYLNVHLASESVLLLGKLSDAVAQLSQQQGVQINRSIWVAHKAIQSIDAPNSRKMFVTLTDGQTLKVTPKGRKLLEKANEERAVE